MTFRLSTPHFTSQGSFPLFHYSTRDYVVHFHRSKRVILLSNASLQGLASVAIARLTHVVLPSRDSVYDVQTDQTLPFIAFYFELVGGAGKQVRPGTQTRGRLLLLAKLPNTNN